MRLASTTLALAHHQRAVLALQRLHMAVQRHRHVVHAPRPRELQRLRPLARLHSTRPPAATRPSSSAWMRRVSSSFVFSSTAYSSSCGRAAPFAFSCASHAPHAPTRRARNSSRVSCAFFVPSASFSFRSAALPPRASSSEACSPSSCALPWSIYARSRRPRPPAPRASSPSPPAPAPAPAPRPPPGGSAHPRRCRCCRPRRPPRGTRCRASTAGRAKSPYVVVQQRRLQLRALPLALLQQTRRQLVYAAAPYTARTASRRVLAAALLVVHVLLALARLRRLHLRCIATSNRRVAAHCRSCSNSPRSSASSASSPLFSRTARRRL